MTSNQASQQEKNYVLVYGTLRKGGCNHGLMGEAETFANLKLAGFSMVSLGSYPAVYMNNQADKESVEEGDWLAKS